MKQTKDMYRNALMGSLIADAVSMPVHWYYDTDALDKDYGRLSHYTTPKHPHSDSILWRSRYKPRNQRGDILREQVKYWGQRGVHYHQFLQAGENTLNYKLAVELYNLVVKNGRYDLAQWADRYVACMLQDGWHRDTYAEEYHRAFFDNYAQGKSPVDCGIDDIHIGGISQVPALVAALHQVEVNELTEQLAIVEQHVRLTHKNKHVVAAAVALTRMLDSLAQGMPLSEVLEASSYLDGITNKFDTWSNFPDRVVVGRHLSPACYLPESCVASLYLTWKYAEDFSAGILANAHCGGDNCHRGAVVGALLGAANGIPEKWYEGLQAKHPDAEPAPHGAGSYHDPEQHRKLMDRVDSMLRD